MFKVYLSMFLTAALLFFSETSLASSSPVLSQKTAAVKSSSLPLKKKARFSKNKDKTDYWTHCQKIRAKLFKEDFDDSIYPTDPILKEVPTYQPESSPCGFQPDAHSAGLRTKCRW